MRPGVLLPLLLGMVLGVAPPAASVTQAADKIVAGTLGGQAPLLPFYVAENEGFLSQAGIDLDLNFAPTSSGIVQQLAAGSLDVVVSVGMTDPLQAIDRGADLAIVRVIGDAAPYALIAKPSIKSIADLRGKIVSGGAVADETTLYLEQMMAANGLHKGDYDMISGGVAAARLAALQAGAADAAMVLPPLNFHAAAAGFPTIGLAVDYVKDLPFTGMAVQRRWAADHTELARRLLDATNKSMAWVLDPSHRSAAVALLVKVAHANPEDAAASYDFLLRIKYFEPSGAVSRRRLRALIDLLRSRGFVDDKLTVDRVALPGLTSFTE